MSTATHSRLADAVALVAEAAAAPTLEDFPARVVPRLRTLFRADFASFGGGSRPAVWRFDPEDALPALGGDEAKSRMSEHPLVSHMARTGDGRAMRVSDVMGVREFERLPIYEERFRSLGARYQLLAAISFDEPVPRGVGLARARSDFNERERTLLELLRPQLAAAFRTVAERVDARRRIEALERGLEMQGRALAVVRDGRLEPLSRNADALLRSWFGSRPLLPPSGGPVVVERDGVRLRLSVVAGDPPIVLLDETRFRPDPERARALGLTARETEILSLVACELADAEIARDLFLSVRTVEKHLGNTYRKLGVSGRDEAVALLLAR